MIIQFFGLLKGGARPPDALLKFAHPENASGGRVPPCFAWLALLLFLSNPMSQAADSRPPIIPFPAGKPRLVKGEVMRQIYEEVKTPYKYGIVIPEGDGGEWVDCPNVFRHNGRWYMMFVAIKDKVGYETHLAVSDDLLHWERLGKILTFSKQGWDAWQADGGIALYDTQWGGSHELSQHEGQYWLSYLAGAQQGYEPDPLAIGLAHTSDPVAIREWTRLPNNPVLAPGQSDTRDFEHVTLYKSAIIRDESKSLGAPFVMFYNGKSQPYGQEAIGIAISQDLHTWQRFGHGSVLSNVGSAPWAISGDPQLTKIGDVWVMFYFGAWWKPNAFDTFACSYDLIHWTKWDGPLLIEPTESWDKTYAHKPWVLKHDGVVYHFYCAVGDKGRVIALATSQDLKAK